MKIKKSHLKREVNKTTDEIMNSQVFFCQLCQKEHPIHGEHKTINECNALIKKIFSKKFLNPTVEEWIEKDITSRS